MANTDPRLHSLDRIQAEFNRTASVLAVMGSADSTDLQQLENLGRTLSAYAKQDKSSLVSHTAKLKRQLPKSIASFHEALDQLEEDLELAHVVMRRDLAVLREKSTEQSVKAESTPVPPVATDNVDPAPGPTNLKEANSMSPQIKMQPVSREPPQQPAQEARTPEAEQHQPQDMEDVKPTTEPTDDAGTAAAADSLTAPTTTATKQDRPAPADEIDFSTPPNQPASAPDTATTAPTNDLDSLFNASPRPSDPNSTAQNSGPATASGPADHDFDFDAFNATLDVPGDGGHGNGLEGLLPGLRDYSNTQPGEGGGNADDDFDALFSAPAAREGDGQGEDLGNLMDFEAFVGDGAGNGGNGGGGEAGTAGGSDADLFDYDFTS